MAWLHLRHWPLHTPQPLEVEQVTEGVPGKGTKAIATANLQTELPEFDHKNLP